MKLFAVGHSDVTLHYSHEEFLDRLALEASIQSNVIAFFKEGLPSITQKFAGFAAALKAEPQHPNITSIEKDFISLEKKHLEKRYLVYRDVLIQVPEGFKGEFLPYVLALHNTGVKLYEQTHQLLTEYRFVLSSIITNQEQRTSLKDLSASYAKVTTARSELEKGLAPYFGNSSVSRARLISVLPSFREGKELVRAVKQLNHFTEHKQLQAIQESVKETADILGLLQTQMTKGDLTEISPNVVKNIALGAHELARYIDSVVVFHYATLSIIACIDEMMKKMTTFD